MSVPTPHDMDPIRARRIVNHLASTGTPPDEGVDAFTVGLDGLLGVLDEEYLAFLGQGLSAFKLVVGAYGGGKTHLLLSIRERAFRRGAAVAYLTLNPQESPFAPRRGWRPCSGGGRGASWPRPRATRRAPTSGRGRR